MLARGYQLPQTGDTAPHRNQLPHQRAKAANGGNLPPSRGQRHQRRESTSITRPMPPMARNYPRTRRIQIKSRRKQRPYPAQEIITPSGGKATSGRNLPFKGATPPTVGNYPKQENNAASGGNLPQGWRTTIKSRQKQPSLPQHRKQLPQNRRQARHANYTP